ncbi:MAG: hypothetical protein Fur0032_02510 [Terrimicrobiaceae bacterium]
MPTAEGVKAIFWWQKIFQILVEQATVFWNDSPVPASIKYSYIAVIASAVALTGILMAVRQSGSPAVRQSGSPAVRQSGLILHQS